MTVNCWKKKKLIFLLFLYTSKLTVRTIICSPHRVLVQHILLFDVMAFPLFQDSIKRHSIRLPHCSYCAFGCKRVYIALKRPKNMIHVYQLFTALCNTIFHRVTYDNKCNFNVLRLYVLLSMLGIHWSTSTNLIRR